MASDPTEPTQAEALVSAIVQANIQAAKQIAEDAARIEVVRALTMLAERLADPNRIHILTAQDILAVAQDIARAPRG